jgi:hypothetical protein
MHRLSTTCLCTAMCATATAAAATGVFGLWATDQDQRMRNCFLPFRNLDTRKLKQELAHKRTTSFLSLKGNAMREYDMRLHRQNGVLSVVMKTVAIDDNDARRAASQFLIGDIVSASIFNDEKDVGVVRRVFSWSEATSERVRRLPTAAPAQPSANYPRALSKTLFQQIPS